MKHGFGRLLWGVVLLVQLIPVWARPVSVRGPVRLDDADPDAVPCLMQHLSGNVRYSISNRGVWGNPDATVGYRGFEWPLGSFNDFLWTGGLWIGASLAGQGAVSTTTDGDNGTQEFWPVHIGLLPAEGNGHPGWDDWWLSSTCCDSMVNWPGHWYLHRSQRGVDDDGDWHLLGEDWDANGLPSANWDGGHGFLFIDDDADGTVDEEQANGLDDDNDGRTDEDTDAASDTNNDGDAGYDPEPGVDEDPLGNMAADYLDNDHDGLADGDDPDHDGDLWPDSNNDDNDTVSDEDGLTRGLTEFFAVFQDSIQAGYVRYPDAGGHLPLDIVVTQRSYILADFTMRDVVFMDFTVRNRRAAPLEGVYVGLFVNMDIMAAGGFEEDYVDDYCYYDAALHMMGQYDDPTDGDGAGPGVLGVQLVRPPREFASLLLGYHTIERVEGDDPPTNAEKYALISSGSVDPSATVSGDWRTYLTFGTPNAGFALAPGQALDFTVALLAAADSAALSALAAHTTVALASDVILPVSEPASVYPAEIALYQNYPNPFNASTRIAFKLPHTGPVTLQIYDLNGRHVRTLANGVYNAGPHSVTFAAHGLSSGVYFYRLETPGHTTTRKLILLK